MLDQSELDNWAKYVNMISTRHFKHHRERIGNKLWSYLFMAHESFVGVNATGDSVDSYYKQVAGIADKLIIRDLISVQPAVSEPSSCAVLVRSNDPWTNMNQPYMVGVRLDLDTVDVNFSSYALTMDKNNGSIETQIAGFIDNEVISKIIKSVSVSTKCELSELVDTASESINNITMGVQSGFMGGWIVAGDECVRHIVDNNKINFCRSEMDYILDELDVHSNTCFVGSLDNGAALFRMPSMHKYVLTGIRNSSLIDSGCIWSPRWVLRELQSDDESVMVEVRHGITVVNTDFYRLIDVNL